jgi:predicted hydrocarbon binding protein
MRFIRISQAELARIKTLYESVMSKASHGLFYREGILLGKEIANLASEDKDKYLETSARLIKGRGWAEDITFDNHTVVVKGSIEVDKGEEPTCHRLRGMIHAVMERTTDKKLVCFEEKCESTGSPHCEFKLREVQEE